MSMETADTLDLAPRAHAHAAPTKWVDYYELTKPRMNFLVLVTTLFGFYMASGAEGIPSRSMRPKMYSSMKLFRGIGAALEAVESAAITSGRSPRPIVSVDFDTSRQCCS